MASLLLTTYGRQTLQDWLNNGTVAAAGSRFLSLHTADPGVTGATGEVSGNGYARQDIGAAFPASPAGSDTHENSSAAVDFGTASGGDWGTITHVALWDAVTSGNCIARWALTSSKTVANGEAFEFPIGELEIILPTT